ncbi:MAG: hypothetical protein JY451_02750 [Erythrobacter sp.]|nr:MAG: hypothetical protein JY451_02750 [Erythrobacter sp.]
MKRLFLLAAAAALSACQPSDGETFPGDASETQPYAGIAEDAVLRITGTEPFWGGTISGGQLTWTTPENIDGITVPVERFAGRGGLSFSGQLEDQQIDIAITPGDCSDGMSDRTYPFNATVELNGQTLSGCAWREGVDELAEA